jgi:hypothetical protein
LARPCTVPPLASTILATPSSTVTAPTTGMSFRRLTLSDQVVEPAAVDVGRDYPRCV